MSQLFCEIDVKLFRIKEIRYLTFSLLTVFNYINRKIFRKEALLHHDIP